MCSVVAFMETHLFYGPFAEFLMKAITLYIVFAEGHFTICTTTEFSKKCSLKGSLKI